MGAKRRGEQGSGNKGGALLSEKLKVKSEKWREAKKGARVARSGYN